jgi:hypothetical protein
MMLRCIAIRRSGYRQLTRKATAVSTPFDQESAAAQGRGNVGSVFMKDGKRIPVGTATIRKAAG